MCLLLRQSGRIIVMSHAPFRSLQCDNIVRPNLGSLTRTVSIRFKRNLVMSCDMPQLTTFAPPSLITEYRQQVKQQALAGLVQDLLVNRCIEKMTPGEKGYFSRVFLVPKKSGGWRLVIDLSQLNKSLAPVTFQMDTLAKVKEVLRPGMWATSVNLSDAYHHIPMHPGSRQFRCFQVCRQRYKYLVLLFGLMSGPWLFTEIAKQLKR